MSEPRPTKQVIVMRKDLNMRKGKMIAQGAHASMAWLTRRLIEGPGVNEVWIHEREWVWLDASFKKICVYVTSEEDLLTIHSTATGLGLTSHLMRDAGLTEFDGVPTFTCTAIGPDYEDVIDAVTGEAGPLGRLPLL